MNIKEHINTIYNAINEVLIMVNELEKRVEQHECKCDNKEYNELNTAFKMLNSHFEKNDLFAFRYKDDINIIKYNLDYSTFSLYYDNIYHNTYTTLQSLIQSNIHFLQALKTRDK